MSKFTTEVRYICETYADDPTLSIEDTITKAKPYIFSSIWNATDEERKEQIEQKILRHYYTQEIGFETVARWKLALNTTLAEIMPKYNLLYTNLDNIKAKLFDTVDFQDDFGSVNTGHSESKTTGSATGHTTDENNGTTEATGSSNSESTTDGTANATNTGKQKYNDTPQGALTGLNDETYLTNATVTEGTNESGSNTKTTASGSTSDKNTTNTTSETNSNTTSTGTNTGDSTNNSNSNRHVYGKNTGGDYLTQWLNLMQQYNDIDMMIISELQPLFMGLWE